MMEEWYPITVIMGEGAVELFWALECSKSQSRASISCTLAYMRSDMQKLCFPLLILSNIVKYDAYKAR